MLKRLRGAAVAIALLVPAPAAQAGLITMDELIFQPLNGVSVKGVTFSTADASARFGQPSGGVGSHVSEPAAFGVVGTTLTLDFAAPTSFLSFGFALNTTGSAGDDGVSVELLDSASASLGTFTALTDSLTNAGFEEGMFDVSAAGISRAVIEFSHLDTASAWLLDNVEFEMAMPEPGALAIFGLGLLGLGLVRRRGR